MWECWVHFVVAGTGVKGPVSELTSLCLPPPLSGTRKFGLTEGSEPTYIGIFPSILDRNRASSRDFIFSLLIFK